MPGQRADQAREGPQRQLGRRTGRGRRQFQVLIITDDDQRHVLAPSPAAMTALVALAQADTVLMWDPTNRTLIAANVVGTMPWTERL
jgi:hypothetical protein